MRLGWIEVLGLKNKKPDASYKNPQKDRFFINRVDSFIWFSFH